MVRSPPSLIVRLTSRLAAITLLALLAAFVWLYYQLDYTSDRFAERTLIMQAHEIARGLRPGPDGISLSLNLADDAVSAQALERGAFRYAATDAGGNVRLASPWPPTPLKDIRFLSGVQKLYETDHTAPVADTFLGVASTARINGEEFTVQVERDDSGFETLMDALLVEFVEHGAWLSVPFLLALLMVTFYTVRSAILPINRLSAKAQEIGPVTLDLRLPEEGVPRELLGLVTAMNSVLDRLDAGFQIQKDFSAHAAHELRTPLAVLGAHIDTLEDRKVAAALRYDLDRMISLTEALLRVAQLDSATVAGDPVCDAVEAAIAAATLLAPLAAKKGVSMEVTGGEHRCLIHADREPVVRAVRNLLENAIAHSASRAPVLLELTADGVIRVIDRGPGIADDNKEKVFQRFWRGQSGGQGCGLGLAIVARTMQLYRGEVTLHDTPGGGATFALHFRPLATPPSPGERARAPAPLDAKRPDSGAQQENPAA